jgi:hypothetical protein
MHGLIRDAFKPVGDSIKDLVDLGCYDLVVDEDIILPSCWNSLVEPGWKVKMLMWPIPKQVPRRQPRPPKRPLSRRSPAISTNSPGSLSTWATDPVLVLSAFNRHSVYDDSSIYVIRSSWNRRVKRIHFPRVLGRRGRGEEEESGILGRLRALPTLCLDEG